MVSIIFSTQGCLLWPCTDCEEECVAVVFFYFLHVYNIDQIGSRPNVILLSVRQNTLAHFPVV